MARFGRAYIEGSGRDSKAGSRCSWQLPAVLRRAIPRPSVRTAWRAAARISTSSIEPAGISFLAVDARGEVRVVTEDAVHAQNVRDQVVGEMVSSARSSKRPDPWRRRRARGRGRELSAFVERHALVAVLRDVIEERHRTQQPDQCLGGISGALDKRCKASAIRIDQQTPRSFSAVANRCISS